MQKTTLIQDFRRFNMGWRIWMLVLQVVNLVMPLFFLGRPEAWAVLAGYVLAAAFLIPLHRRLGWVRLLGIIHFQWFVIVPWLLFRYAETSPSGVFGAWLITVIAVNGICLVIDVVDVIRYLAGDRQPVVNAKIRTG